MKVIEISKGCFVLVCNGLELSRLRDGLEVEKLNRINYLSYEDDFISDSHKKYVSDEVEELMEYIDVLEAALYEKSK